MTRPTINTVRWLLAVAVATLMLSLASGVWAAPGQSGLRATVPTRTPKPEPTAQPTAVPAQPTAAPAQPTAKPQEPKPKPQPAQSTAPAAAVPAAQQAAATATTVAQAGYPETGADHTPRLLMGAGMVSLAATAAVWAVRRRRAAR
ncbi:MAG: LPXTG cell wall anchor domain-containing protein [Chloroflexota bacterium]